MNNFLIIIDLKKKKKLNQKQQVIRLHNLDYSGVSDSWSIYDSLIDYHAIITLAEPQSWSCFLWYCINLLFLLFNQEIVYQRLRLNIYIFSYKNYGVVYFFFFLCLRSKERILKYLTFNLIYWHRTQIVWFYILVIKTMLRYLGFPYILFYQKELGLLKYMQESLIFKFIGTIFMKVRREKHLLLLLWKMTIMQNIIFCQKYNMKFFFTFYKNI